MAVAALEELTNLDRNPDHSAHTPNDNSVPKYLFEKDRPLITSIEFDLIKNKIYKVFNDYLEADDQILLGKMPDNFFAEITDHQSLRLTLWNRMTDEILVQKYSEEVRSYITKSSPNFNFIRIVQPVLRILNKKTNYLPIIYLCRVYAKNKDTNELDIELNKLLKIEQ